MKKRLNRLLFLLILTLFLGCGAEGFYVPGSIDQSPTPTLCDQEEFASSLICSTLKANGYTAEQTRDDILDAHAISLITELYTIEQVNEITNEANDFLLKDNLRYEDYFHYLSDELKAQQIAGIISRRLPGLPMTQYINPADRELLRRLNLRIREASGLPN